MKGRKEWEWRVEEGERKEMGKRNARRRKEVEDNGVEFEREWTFSFILLTKYMQMGKTYMKKMCH